MTHDLVLTFHGIGEPPAGIPEAERPYWMPEAEFLSFVAAAPERARAAGVRLIATFDDGNISDLAIAAPALRRAGIAGIFFPCSGRIGQPGYLGAEDIRRLAAEGFAIGSHGVDHVRWAGLGAEALRRETGESKAALEAVLDRPVSAAALPFGAYDRRVLAALGRAGYREIYSSDPGFADPRRRFRRRWSFREGMTYEIGALVRASRDPARRVTGALKHLVKSLR